MNDDIKNPIKISKKRITAIIVVAVLLIAIISTSIYVSVNKVKVYSDIIYTFMDKEKLAEDDTNRLYHIRKNPEFKSKGKDATILDAFEIYFEDENGKMCYYTSGDNFPYDGDEAGADVVILIFISSALVPLKKIGTAVAVIVPIIVIVGLIVLWYKLWSKKEDEERAKRIAKYNQKKK